MNPEEYLDRLIERREHGEVQLPVTNSEVTVSLAAAEVLAQLQGIDVPPAFAGHLELHIRASARSLAQQNGRTIPHKYVRSNTMKIMVADHDRDMVDMLSFWLKGHGYDVVRAFDGEQAIKRWHETWPDLVLLDLHLPKRDGFEVCQQMRSETNATALILTGSDCEEDEVRGLEMGADDYLRKPLSPRQLLARITAVMRRSSHAHSASGSSVMTLMKKCLTKKRAGEGREEVTKSTKIEADNVSLSSDELVLRDSERRPRDAKHGSNSLIRASLCGEQQAVVLVRHPDHTVGQARSTSVKPISDVVSLPKV